MENLKEVYKFSEEFCSVLNVLKNIVYVRVDYLDYEGNEAHEDGIFKGVYGSRTIKLEVNEKISPKDDSTVKSQVYVPLRGEGKLKIQSIVDGYGDSIFSINNKNLFNISKEYLK